MSIFPQYQVFEDIYGPCHPTLTKEQDNECRRWAFAHASNVEIQAYLMAKARIESERDARKQDMSRKEMLSKCIEQSLYGVPVKTKHQIRCRLERLLNELVPPHMISETVLRTRVKSVFMHERAGKTLWNHYVAVKQRQLIECARLNMACSKNIDTLWDRLAQKRQKDAPLNATIEKHRSFKRARTSSGTDSTSTSLESDNSPSSVKT